MALFKIPGPAVSKTDSPTLLFRDLTRDPSIKFLYEHQGKLLDDYHLHHLKTRDIAIELPTGAGKTLVAMMIAEYRRRTFNERVVFLCPTRQLCTQVQSQAKKYGVPTSLLTGTQSSYEPSAFYGYQQAKTIALSTYSGVFNTNPRINDAQLIICDDAHAAESYIADLWTVTISRKHDHETFEAIFRCLESVIPDNVRFHMLNYEDAPRQAVHVDLLSAIAAEPHYDRLREAMKPFTTKRDDSTKLPSFAYPWRNISGHLEACSIYCSPEYFEIRPPLPPTLSHLAFAGATQRIYMSATLSENGDIERSFGVRSIARLPVPQGWDKRGTGRRFIIFPGLSSQKSLEITSAVLNSVNRSLILVPDDRTKKRFASIIPPSTKIISSTDIESSLDSFVKHPGPAVLLIANRYDGIDLPGDDCRVMALNGLPIGAGLQERYFVSRLGAVSQLRDRIRTRITQAIGRCTRDESDFSVVLLLGEDLLKWCCTTSNVNALHPEIQAEIQFGLENSKDCTVESALALTAAFLSKSPEWQGAEDFIKQQRTLLSKTEDENAQALANSAKLEIDYLYRSWNAQHEEALAVADQIASALEGGKSLKPYRSFWHHQAAVSAFLAWKRSGKDALKQAASSALQKASASASGLAWLPHLQANFADDAANADNQAMPIQEWFQEINSLLEEWHVTGSRFSRELTEAKRELDQDANGKAFERGLNKLGRMLGAKVHEWTDDGKPDGLWVFGERIAFVFEAKTDEKPEGVVALSTVRQALTHENNVRAEKLIAPHVPCHTILISRRQRIDKSAAPHCGEIRHLLHQDVVKLFEHAAMALEQTRAVAQNTVDEALQEYCVDKYQHKQVFIPNIERLLLRTKLADLPIT